MVFVRRGRHECALPHPAKHGDIWKCETHGCGRYWKAIVFPDWRYSHWNRITRLGEITRRLR